MATKFSLQLSFLTDQNKKVKVTIPNPKQPVDNKQVDAAMDLIVSKQVFAFPQGKIVKKIGAEHLQTDSASIS